MRLRGLISLAIGLVGIALAAVGYHERQAIEGLGGSVVGFLAVVLSLSSRERREEMPLAAEPEVAVEPVDPITDPLTGLMNDIFFSGLLGTKVATARRRLWPLSIVLLQVVIATDDDAAIDSAIYEFSNIVRTTLRTADVACRVGARTFGLLLDDTDEDGAAWVAERIQIAQARRADNSVAKVCAGVSSYPSHGIEPGELMTTAKEALRGSMEEAESPGLGKVIVAPQRPL